MYAFAAIKVCNCPGNFTKKKGKKIKKGDERKKILTFISDANEKNGKLPEANFAILFVRYREMKLQWLAKIYGHS